MAVAGTGVAMKVTMITGMFAMGVGQGIIYIPALYILNSCFGANGLIWAQPVADVLSIGLAAALYITTSKKNDKRQL